MKKMYKAMALVLCAVLLMAGSIFGTLAYLQSKTETVTNTFVTGKVEITLHEYEIDNTTGEKKDVKVENGGLVGIKLVPNREIQKNPVITVKAGSEKCYLFVKVEDGLKGLATINWDNNKWQNMTGTNIYYYTSPVTVSATEDEEVEVFPSIQCKNVEKYENADNISLAITAYAVQADGFDNAAAAWTASGFGSNTENNG